ncbi:hypothetical protein EJ02DRAFT_438202 [Clathrospora elynae]|uniref:Uncharacterized protein n=1 Tax=Clathrospora elynae TaxID=706981 RepID=A0A6A5S8D3_9PLEO|nr:hypothetical protein EJ02DRAFT_438202 [Clathrospora elynae]
MMTDDLISLVDDSESISHAMVDNRPKTAARDSFSDLAGLMKAKKPYSPISPPTPRLPLALGMNGMRIVSRNVSGSSMLSPLARPFQVPGSVAAYLQEQELVSPMRSPPSVPAYRKVDMIRLDSMTEWIEKYHIDDEPVCRLPSPLNMEPLLIPNLEPPARFGPVDPPTPTESAQPTLSAFQPARDREPVVRLTQQAWESMGRDLDTITKQKQALEKRLAELERHNETLRTEEHGVSAQLGKLRYQNEVNKEQKSAMGRSLAQKDVELKNQKLEIDELTGKLGIIERRLQELGGELDYLRSIQSSNEAAHERELDNFRGTVRDLQVSLEQITRERDVASRTQVNSGDHLTRAQNLADTLVKREKIMMDMRLQLCAEKLKVVDLEDALERLQEESKKADIDELRTELREKTSLCDRQRNDIKTKEAHLKASQERVMRVANNGESLQGAAHLVVPKQNGKLPKTVISCSECYASNTSCDSAVKCRSCTERNATCARWRCSLKHKLGNCPMAPCKLPHDLQGWLVLPAERPQW